MPVFRHCPRNVAGWPCSPLAIKGRWAPISNGMQDGNYLGSLCPTALYDYMLFFFKRFVQRLNICFEWTLHPSRITNGTLVFYLPKRGSIAIIGIVLVLLDINALRNPYFQCRVSPPEDFNNDYKCRDEWSNHHTSSTLPQ